MRVYVVGGGDNPAPAPGDADPVAGALRKRGAVLPGHSVLVSGSGAEIVFDACSPHALARARGRPILLLSADKPEHRRYASMAAEVYAPPSRVPEQVGGLKITVIRGYGEAEAYAYLVSEDGARVLYISDMNYIVDELPSRVDVLVVGAGCGLELGCENHYTLVDVFDLVQAVRPRVVFVTHLVPPMPTTLLRSLLRDIGYGEVYVVVNPYEYDTSTGELYEYELKPVARRI